MKPLDAAIDMREECKFYSLFNLNSIQLDGGYGILNNADVAVANGVN